MSKQHSGLTVHDIVKSFTHGCLLICTGWRSQALSLSLLSLVSLAPSAVMADTCTAPDESAEYRLVFEDNFNGNALNQGKWETQFLWGPGVIINRETQYYVNEGQFGYNPFTVNNGTLSIKAIKTPFDRSQLYLTSSIYSATSLELLWRSPANAVAYNVYRDGDFRARVTGGSYYEPSVREGIDYAFEVVAVDANENEIVTAQLTINTGDRPQSVAAKPFGLHVSHKVYSSSSAELNWDGPNRAASFDIYRNGTLYKHLVGGDYDSLYEGNLQRGVDYQYEVQAFDHCNELILSESTVINTAAGVTPPPTAAERLVIALNIYSKHTAEISWNAVSGANSYDIYENGTFIENTKARSVFRDDLVPGQDVRFKVVVLDKDGNTIDSTSRALNTADNSFALNRQPYLSGIITSYHSFRFLYGRVEMRARMPEGKGLWSAFWLLNAYYKQDQPEDPEIDIIEAIGDKTTISHQAYHYASDPDGDGVYNKRNSTEFRTTISDFSENYHTYRVDWSEGLIVWYIDGVEVNRLTGDAVSSEQMYIIANLAVGGGFPGPADETTPFPASFDIDYIRVYQR